MMLRKLSLFQLKNTLFTALKERCILHRHNDIYGGHVIFFSPGLRCISSAFDVILAHRRVVEFCMLDVFYNYNWLHHTVCVMKMFS